MTMDSTGTQPDIQYNQADRIELPHLPEESRMSSMEGHLEGDFGAAASENAGAIISTITGLLFRARENDLNVPYVVAAGIFFYADDETDDPDAPDGHTFSDAEVEAFYAAVDVWLTRRRNRTVYSFTSDPLTELYEKESEHSGSQVDPPATQ